LFILEIIQQDLTVWPKQSKPEITIYPSATSLTIAPFSGFNEKLEKTLEKVSDCAVLDVTMNITRASIKHLIVFLFLTENGSTGQILCCRCFCLALNREFSPVNSLAFVRQNQEVNPNRQLTHFDGALILQRLHLFFQVLREFTWVNT
jgi:hypothetical protein